MDKVLIEALKVEARIGIFEWEQRIRQQITFELALGTDARKAAASDCIEDALDYMQVAKRVRDLVETSSFGLLETVAEAVATMLAEEFGIRWMRITVRKSAIDSHAAAVGVTVERGNIGDA